MEASFSLKIRLAGRSRHPYIEKLCAHAQKNKKDCRIAIYRDADIMEIIDDEEKLKDLLGWSVDMAKKYKETFSPRIASL